MLVGEDVSPKPRSSRTDADGSGCSWGWCRWVWLGWVGVGGSPAVVGMGEVEYYA